MTNVIPNVTEPAKATTPLYRRGSEAGGSGRRRKAVRTMDIQDISSRPWFISSRPWRCLMLCSDISSRPWLNQHQTLIHTEHQEEDITRISPGHPLTQTRVYYVQRPLYSTGSFFGLFNAYEAIWMDGSGRRREDKTTLDKTATAISIRAISSVDPLSITPEYRITFHSDAPPFFFFWFIWFPYQLLGLAAVYLWFIWFPCFSFNAEAGFTAYGPAFQ